MLDKQANIINILKQDRARTIGSMDAIDEIHRQREENPEAISEQGIEPPQITLFASVDEVDSYKATFYAALKDLVRRSQDDNKEIEWSSFRRYLFREMLTQGGCQDAIDFVLEANADVDVIQAEILENHKLIEMGLARNPTGAMSPSASPRIYRDGYIGYLEKILSVIQNMP